MGSGVLCAMRSASSGLPATSTLNPLASSRSCAMDRTSGSSSTTRIVSTSFAVDGRASGARQEHEQAAAEHHDLEPCVHIALEAPSHEEGSDGELTGDQQSHPTSE